MKYRFPWEKQQDLVLDADMSWDSGYGDLLYYISVDRVLEIKHGVWYLKKWVKWDGITNFWCGPFDKSKPYYPITWLASLVHDIGCKYWNEDKYFPCSRFKIDWFFFKELRRLDNKVFKYFLAYVYYAAVTLFTIYKYTTRILK